MKTERKYPISTVNVRPVVQENGTTGLLVEPVPPKLTTDEAEDALDTILQEVDDWKPEYCIGVVRYSDDQQEEGTTEARQMTRITEACEEREWPKPVWRVDKGVSAWCIDKKTGKTKNLSPGAQLGGLIQDAIAGKIKPGTVVIIENPDRFSRADLDDADSALMTLLRNGVSVLFLSVPMLMRYKDRNNPIKRLILMLEFHRANKESERKSRLIRASYEFRLEAAKRGEQVNFGGVAPSWITFDETLGKNVPVPAKWAQVERLALDVINNRMLGEMVRELNTSEVPTLEKKSGRWHNNTIRRILTNPALKGTLVLNGTVVDDYYPAVVDEHQWILLQARFANRLRPGGGSSQSAMINNLFPSRVRCHHCGSLMVARPSRYGFGSRTYYCTGYEKGTSKNGVLCQQSHRVFVEPIEIELFGLLLSKMPNALLIKRDEARDLEVAAKQAKITQLEGEIWALNQMFSAAPIEKLKAEAAEKYKQRCKLQDEITEMLKETSVETGVTSAWSLILKEITGITDITDITDEQLVSLLSGAEEMSTQLSDQDLRKRLIGPLKMLVSAIDLDITDQRKLFRVKLAGGGFTDWIDITEQNRLSEQARRMKSWTAERRAAFGAQQRARIAANPISEETRKKLSKVRKGKKLSSASKARVAAAMAARWAEKKAAGIPWRGIKSEAQSTVAGCNHGRTES